jgi:hypothetical protein
MKDFKIINNRLMQAKNLEIDWFNGNESVNEFKRKLTALLNLGNTSKQLRKKLLSIAKSNVRFAHKPDLRSYKLMRETLKTIRDAFSEATKVAVNKPGEAEKLARYNDLTKAINASYLKNFNPNITATGAFAQSSVADELNNAIERIGNLLARYEEA